jgi:hypothetical protein
MGRLRALLPDPAERRLDVLDDLRHLRLGRKAVVDRHQREPLGPAKLQQIARDLGAAAHDQRAAVHPDEHGPRLRDLSRWTSS